MESVDWFTVFVTAVAFYAVFKLGQWSVILPMRNLLKKVEARHDIDIEKLLIDVVNDLEDIEQQTKLSERAVNVERVDGQYFAYAVDGEFLAQGADFRTMFETIKQRFPNMNFRVQKLNTTLSDEESQRMVTSIFEVFGDKNDKKSNSK